jgi:hypothetical protein
MEILIVFLLKLIDNTFNTMKTIYISKEKFFCSSLFAALSTTVYMIDMSPRNWTPFARICY